MEKTGSDQVHPGKKRESSVWFCGTDGIVCRSGKNTAARMRRDGLDVSLLQDHLLAPVLGIKNPKTDTRIDFVGGIRGLSELERRVSSDCEAALPCIPPL